jgi:hypothetical protein
MNSATRGPQKNKENIVSKHISFITYASIVAHVLLINSILQNRHTISASTYHTNTTIKPSTGLLSPVSLVSNWPSPPNTTPSISTSSHKAYTPLNNGSCNSFDNNFEDATQWDTLGSSAVNTFGDATVRLPPSAVPPTWDNGWMPEADPQSCLYLSVPLSAIQDELAIDEEQGDSGTLLRPSNIPMTWQNLTLIPSTVRSQHKPASGGSKKSRRSSRNSNSSTTCARKHSSLAKTSDRSRLVRIASTITYIPPTPHHQALGPTQPNNIPYRKHKYLLRATIEHRTILWKRSIAHD